MAESVEQLNGGGSGGDKFQTVVRRKLERFRAKLAELFFSSTTTTATMKRDTSAHIDIICTDLPNNNNNNNSMLISNYYYGYTTSPVNENTRVSVKTSKIRQTSRQVEEADNSSSSCTSSSSMIIEEAEVSQPVGVITLTRPVDYATFNTDLNADYSNYDTSSLNTNNEEEDNLHRNPFLNKKLTDQIHFNADLALLHAYFEASLDSIDGSMI